jgi:hypothetical protein
MAGLTQADATPGASGHQAIETLKTHPQSIQETSKKRINDLWEHD